MKCKKCEKNLDKDSKFCTNCGGKVNNEIEVKKEIEAKIKENKDFNNIKMHLEFLGYSTKFGEGSKDVVTLLSTHIDKPNILCTSSKDGVIFLTSTWTGLKDLNSIEQYKVINKLNLDSVFSQCVINDNGDLNVHSTFIGEYDKKRFGEFVDIYLNDISRALNNESFKRLIVK